jgi:hypothetical protein
MLLRPVAILGQGFSWWVGIVSDQAATLPRNQRCVVAALTHELSVRTLLDDTAVLENND